MSESDFREFLTATQGENQSEINDASEALMELLDEPGAPENTRELIVEAKKLLEDGKVFEAEVKIPTIYLTAWGASESRIKNIEEEATNFAKSILDKIKQLTTVSDEDKVVEYIVLDVLSQYLWAIADGPLTFDTPLSVLVTSRQGDGLPSMEESYLEDIAAVLANP